MNNKLVLSYLAGVIDSDGSITIAVDTWRVRNKGYAPSYSENIAIGQCDPQAINLLKETFGGHIRIEKARGEFRRPVYFWGVTDKNAVLCARALLPYLRIKRRQAELMLRLRKIKDRGREVNTYLEDPPVMRNTRWGMRPYRRRFLRPEVQAEYDALVTEVRSLNDT